MDTAIDFMKGFNLQTILSLIAIVWYFTSQLKSEIKSDIKSLEKRIDTQDERIFLMSTGKTLREAIIEAKKKSEEGG